MPVRAAVALQIHASHFMTLSFGKAAKPVMQMGSRIGLSENPLAPPILRQKREASCHQKLQVVNGAFGVGGRSRFFKSFGFRAPSANAAVDLNWPAGSSGHCTLHACEIFGPPPHSHYPPAGSSGPCPLPILALQGCDPIRLQATHAQMMSACTPVTGILSLRNAVFGKCQQ